MISAQEKKNLFLKVLFILLSTLFVLSIVRVIAIHYDSINTNFIYTLIIKELSFSILSALFVAAILYIFVNKEIYRVNSVMSCAFTDALTGLYNRHYLNDFLEKFTSLRKEDANFAVLFIDIDKFKVINDTLGHSAGDYILKTFASKLQSLTRAKDILCRYGGEEFIIILSDISKEDALQKAEHMRASIECMVFDCEQPGITISAGLSFGGRGDNINQVIEESDKALYMAKEAGRNCVKIFTP